MTAVAPHRFGPARDWQRQLAIFVGAYAVYSIGRYLALGSPPVALANAHSIVDLERGLALDIEGAVQAALTDTAGLWIANHVYLAAQFVVVPGVLVWLYRHARGHYRLLRDTVLLAWLISLPIYALFPVTPPRLAEVGLIDTISSQTGVALDSRLATRFYNPLAAVPSLHAGFALAVAAVAWMAMRTKLSLIAALAWPAVVAVAVVATGNHFILDIAAGWLVTATSCALVVFARHVVRERRRSVPGAPRWRPPPVRRLGGHA
jgi:membrane-associated phospholipid phosphatase